MVVAQAYPHTGNVGGFVYMSAMPGVALGNQATYTWSHNIQQLGIQYDIHVVDTGSKLSKLSVPQDYIGGREGGKEEVSGNMLPSI